MSICGIYKITNLINKKSYIGQSRNVKRRWDEHKSRAFNPLYEGYDYPLYRSFRKYGINNFSFDIIEVCSVEQLNEKENYWINYYSPDYNQTIGKDYQSTFQKLNPEKVKEIQAILIESQKNSLEISLKDLGNKYSVSQFTIRDINNGRTWFNDKLIYPLYFSKYVPNVRKESYCPICGEKISKGATYCLKHFKNTNQKVSKINISREDLKNKIRTMSFTQIGKEFNVTDNAIRKKCKYFNLPFRKKDIKQYSDKEWDKI